MITEWLTLITLPWHDLSLLQIDTSDRRAFHLCGWSCYEGASSVVDWGILRLHYVNFVGWVYYINWDRKLVRKRKSKFFNLFSPSCVTASLGSITETLNYKWDCAYAKDFPSWLKTPTWAKWRPLLERKYGLWEGINSARSLSGIRTKTNHGLIWLRIGTGSRLL